MSCSPRKATVFSCLSLALGIAAPAGAAPPQPVRATVTVEAGELARQHTPVEFALPAGLAGDRTPLELRDERGRRLPLQVNGGQARFILPALGRGQRVRFEVIDGPAGAVPAASGAAKDGVDVRQEGDHLLVTVAGAPVFHFRTTAPAPTAEVPARYTRAGYLHPVFTPAGLTVTDDSPADHGHHHGIWTAWTVAEFEGRHMSFWGPEPGRSKNDLVAVGPTFSGPLAGGFTARLASTDLGVKPPRPVLDSEWKVVVHRPPGKPGKAPYFLFDLDWTDKAAGASPLILPEYRYGGLGVRGNRAWIDATRVEFLTSEGADRLAGENTRARWVHLGGELPAPNNRPGKPVRAGLAVLVHPLNVRAPEPVRLNPGVPLLCVSPVKAGPLKIEAGKPYAARYRFVVSDGPPDRALLERLWRDFARAPVVKVTTPAAAVRIDR
jgi:hypothetical protein